MRGRGGLGSLGGPRWVFDFKTSKLTPKLSSRVNISAAPQDRVHSETSTEVIGKRNDCATKKALLKDYVKRLFVSIQSEIHLPGP